MRSTKVATAVSASAIVLSLIGCSSSHLGRGLNVAVAGSGISDYVTTRQAIQRGGSEQNRIVGDGALRQALVKFVGISGVIGLASLVEQREQKRWAQIIRASAVVVWTSAAVLNARVNR